HAQQFAVQNRHAPYFYVDIHYRSILPAVRLVYNCRMYYQVRVKPGAKKQPSVERSEEHTSELQSREKLVCRLLLEKKNRTPRTARRFLSLARSLGTPPYPLSLHDALPILHAQQFAVQNRHAPYFYVDIHYRSILPAVRLVYNCRMYYQVRVKPGAKKQPSVE